MLWTDATVVLGWIRSNPGKMEKIHLLSSHENPDICGPNKVETLPGRRQSSRLPV